MAVDSPRSEEKAQAAFLRLNWLRRWMAFAALALIAATWPLWTPQTDFPQIPFLAVLRRAPAWIDWLALAGLVSSLFGLLLASSLTKARANGAESDSHAINPAPVWSVCLFVGSVLLLVLLDQHRFQPWAYQFAIAAMVLAFVPAARGLSLLRMLAIGIYFWSAVSKFDHDFLNGIGLDLLRGLVTALQLDFDRLNPAKTALAVWMFPTGELAVALLLAFRRTRLTGLVAAIAMHVALLLTLGPFGLDHEAGVLLWNVYFIGQNILLFGPWPDRGAEAGAGRSNELSRGPTLAARFATGAACAAVLLPVLEPFGLLDHWPGWAVYAPGAERVSLRIDARAIDRLPTKLPRYLGPIDLVSETRVLRTDLWSLYALSAPIYPQGRFRAGVALATIERFELEEAATIVVESRADRVTGRRNSRTFAGPEGFRELAGSFRLNALPRKIGDW